MVFCGGIVLDGTVAMLPEWLLNDWLLGWVVHALSVIRCAVVHDLPVQPVGFVLLRDLLCVAGIGAVAGRG